MIVVEQGFAFTLTQEDFAEFVAARAAGHDHSIGMYGVEIGDCVGDVSNLSPNSAKLLMMAMEAHARGEELTGQLAIFAQAVEAIDDGMRAENGELPAWKAA